MYLVAYGRVDPWPAGPLHRYLWFSAPQKAPSDVGVLSYLRSKQHPGHGLLHTEPQRSSYIRTANFTEDTKRWHDVG